MNNDDSFNDSDEIFNMYSSKKVTEIFKSQLQKIISSNHNSKECEVVQTKVDSVSEGEKKGAGRKKKTVIEDSPPVEVVEEDDSVVLVEDIPSSGSRKSERLRRKRRKGTELFISDLDSPITKPRSKKRGRKKKTIPVIDEIILDSSPQPPENLDDELNPEVSVKVIWKSVNVKKFQIRKFQKLSKVFESISTEENIPEDKIMLTFNGVRVTRNDTPDSLNLQVYHFLDGGVLSELTNSCESSNLHNSTHSDNDSVRLKFQDANKKIVNLKLNKNDKLKVAMIKYSEQLEIPLDRIKFFFDGDPLEPSETPASLGLENDEIIDIKLKS